MNLKRELANDLNKIGEKIVDHETILLNKEVQKHPDIKHYIESRIAYYNKRKEITEECIRLIYGGVDSEQP